jgi:hypothetical protein
MNTLRKQVFAGLLMALLIMTAILFTPASTVATSGGGDVHCHYVCCLYVSGWCVWTGCIECYTIDPATGQRIPFPSA